MSRIVYVPRYQRRGGAVVYIAVARWRYGVKIGFSTIPVVRRIDLEYQQKAPVRLVYATDPIMDAVKVERRSHQILAASARGGEWFAVDIATAKSVVRRARRDVANGWKWSPFGRSASQRGLQMGQGHRAPGAGKRPVTSELVAFAELLEKIPEDDWPERWR